MVLKSSGGHRITYGWQAGGTHPAGMLSCCIYVFVVWRGLLAVYLSVGGGRWINVILYQKKTRENAESTGFYLDRSMQPRNIVSHFK